ncbi:MAG: RHS repeat-associated core domain-containing protein [Planctomycetaceae bacterium]|nr:MAG: RHS repeat-associated core domain-containing protein [Planctomycetaceae bacterium]
MAHDAWGKRRPPSNWITPGAGTFLHAQWLRRGFTAHEHIDHVGLIHMGGRVYDPEIGRFLSPDPFVQYPGSAQGMNRYAYVGNNPLSYTDPSGYFIKKFGRALRRSLGAILPIAVQFVPGMQGWGGAFMAGFVGGFLSSGNDLRAGLYGGLMASLTAGFTNGATGTPSLKAAGLRAGAGVLAAHEPRLAAYVALATGSVHAHAQQGWTGVFKFGYKQYTDQMTRQYVARFAEKNGMNWFDFNLGLMAMSGGGNLASGSRWHGEENELHGVSFRGRKGWLFDGVDIVLSYQGLPTASAFHYAYTAAGTDFSAHSLGAIDGNNLASWGMTGKVSVASLPIGNVATAGIRPFQGDWDFINGGMLAKMFSPDSKLVKSGFGGHGWCKVYVDHVPRSGC